MKKNKWFRWAFVAIMIGASFSACTNETEEVMSQNNEIRLTSAITPTSRVANTMLQNTQIVENQQVGVTITGAKGDHKNIAWTASSNGELTNTGSALYWGNGDVNITAYHPHNANWTNAENTFSVSTDQTSDANFLNSDLLWTQQTATPSTAPIELTFTHQLTKINVSLTSDDIEDLSGATVAICGTKTSVTFNTNTGSIYDLSNVAEIAAGTAFTASAIIIPQTINSGTKFIKIEHNGKTFYYTLATNKEFQPGHVYDYTLTVKEKAAEIVLALKSENITDWIQENITGDAEEESASTPAAGTIIIENQELSQALVAVYGSDDITINSDGYAVMDEDYVLAKTELDFQSYDGTISSLDEIEKFTNLQYLDCGYNKTFTTCDLSQNTALISFKIQNSALTSLDFSNNPNLKAVFCNYNEHLESLDLTGCNQLSNLEIFQTALTKATLTIPDGVKQSVDNLLYSSTALEINLTEYPNVTTLGCQNLGLTSLDNYIPETMKSQLLELRCENNQLTELDLSQFPSLTGLFCSNNYITTLDLSVVPGLEYLHCGENYILELDITSNTNLVDWRCGSQKDEDGNTATMTLTLSSEQETFYQNSDFKDWGGNDNVTFNTQE